MMSTNTSNKKLVKVVLFIFPPVPQLYNISPFSIKLESYLRLNGIPHEIVHTIKFGPKGKIPYVHIVSKTEDSEDDMIEVVPDSNVILSKLEDFLNEDSKDSKAKLKPEEKAMGHAVTRMLEEHTTQIGFYYRYTLSMREFMKALDVRKYMFNADNSLGGAFGATMFQLFMPGGIAKRTEGRGLKSHSDDELWKFSNDDFMALSNYLGGKKYFFGRNHATIIDCTIFGHLTQFLFTPLDFPQKKFVEQHCPNLIEFMLRFKSEHWLDWDQKCERLANV